MKTCNCCNIEKDLSSFSKDSQRKDGYKNTCKECLKNKRNKYICKCENCGKEFKSSVETSKYCSAKCKPQSSTKRIKTKCCICGKEIYKKPYDFKRSKNLYCSIECKSIGNSKFYSGENSHNCKVKIKCNCDYCNKELELIPYRYNLTKHHYCSLKCKNKHRSIWYKGKNHKSYSKVKFKCEICGKEVYQVKSQYENNIHHYCSYECTYKGQSKFYSGENHPCYNPLISKDDRENGRFIEGYDNFIKQVYERDNYTCKCCGDNKGGNLNAHHLNGYDWDKEHRTDINNGITLCEKCHKEFHKKYGYGNNTKQQFEEFYQSW